MAITGALGAIGALGNGSISQQQARSISSGGSIGGGSSSNYGYSQGGTYGTGATASAYSHQMMEEANRFNEEQARLNREWQERMSNTAYQRAMKDLEKAGLNPILAYTNGGASFGSGAQASSAMGNAYTDNSNYSYNSGESSNYERSWNSSQSRERSMSKSDIANQIGSVSGMIAGTIEDIVDGLPQAKQSAAGWFDGLKQKAKDFWNNIGNGPKITTSNGSWHYK